MKLVGDVTNLQHSGCDDSQLEGYKMSLTARLLLVNYSTIHLLLKNYINIPTYYQYIVTTGRPGLCPEVFFSQ